MFKSPLPQAILKTLAYASIFEYPLKSQEINHWLIWPNPKNFPFSKAVKQALKILIQKKTVSTLDDFFFLAKENKIIKKRRLRQIWSQEKLKKAYQTAGLLSFIPTIQMIALSGALAMENAEKEADIDFLIVTKAKTLWTSRALVVLLLKLLGQYRQKNKIADQICPNIFLDQKNLSVPKNKRNLYTAHEVLQLRPLFDRGGVYHQYLKANQWTRGYLPLAYEFPIQSTQSPRDPQNWPLFGLGNLVIGVFLEPLAYSLQLLYMKPKRTRESIARQAAFFHPRDLGSLVLKKYQKKLARLDL